MKIRKAIIPVAGLGTRFLPFTKNTPKEMLPILNKPTIQYIVEEALASGIEEIIFVTSTKKQSLVDYFKRDVELEEELSSRGKQDKSDLVKSIGEMIDIKVAIQDEALGLGHAVLQAKELVNGEDFALLLGDDVFYSEDKPALKQLIDLYEEKDVSVLGVQPVPKEIVYKYGVVDPETESNDDNFKLKGVVEKPAVEVAPSNLTIMGRYVLKNEVFKYLEEKNVDKATNEIQITDSILKLMNNGEVYAKVISGTRYDMGSIEGFVKAQEDFFKRTK